MVNSILIMWFIAVMAAIASISHFMRKRQASLNHLLMQHVKDRRAWSKKKHRSQRLAEQSAAVMRSPASPETSAAQATQEAAEAHAATKHAGIREGNAKSSPAPPEKTPAES